MSPPAKILLIDDSVVIRGLLGRCIDAQDDMTVVSTAPNGKVGVDKVRTLNPDLVVLDIEMPVMTGLEALIEIRKTHPKLPIIMFSTLTAHGASATMKALSAGASDYATKPSNTQGIADAMRQVEEELLTKIRAFTAAKTRAARPSSRPVSRRTSLIKDKPQAVVVGSSTGGPVALETFLIGITPPLSVPMFLVQHMPAKFTLALAERLDRKTPSKVVEAADGMTAEAGVCYIAPGGFHMKVESRGTSTVIRIFDAAPVNSCKPSVDPLFESAAEVYGSQLAVVMLTGMGRDGLEGTRRISLGKCPVIVQDEETSVIWGMPGAVAEAGLATDILPINDIGQRVTSLFGIAPRSAMAGAARGVR